MPAFQINDEEWFYLRGLPYLAREVYFVLRRYMDYSTGITGIQRKVSLKAISEELYVEPHQGLTDSGEPTERQIRRALDWLEKAGLIKRDKTFNKSNKQSVFKLILASRGYSVQNKVDSQKEAYAVSKRSVLEDNSDKGSIDFDSGQVDSSKTSKAVMPPIVNTKTNIYSDDERYSMHVDWFPDWQLFKSKMVRAGLGKATIPPDVLDNFKYYWLGRQNIQKTTKDWEQTLFNYVKNNLVRGKGNASGYSNGIRQGKESLIERTRRKLDAWVAE